ncbi:TIGR03905 family TSCPD domain-containing protein [Acetanaerobacterium sp. MSJ-12]|uniref:ribonucleoside-diphosphate reductase n=1 Tax=Bittarella massiliensis (ex Durand et al. 2017) TaxID=1720313 RepID=A0AAP1PXQ9_9FIRM|nr:MULTISPECIES: TIGR03905 family TSCPD domain-containing protein [Eubacteriales]MCB5941117.1 TIGR03905 family TSCPD domain-containing protein [bacterium 210820-DFI.6.52]ERI99807.1 hypothetical protein HMPREF0262_01489 [Clostridium sp. ATCC 29733]MBC2872172.1 TIGR03905 family TSCPD domain-containing protein [Bittarella massiliensis (ex Durand et al. 2017)]MBU5420473.1 TIGR03905 family TSCPD domain-containing protein [Acetanaerobacterium sp. MSJ-12]MCQ4949831.1 TIGR03905 family TSCPD domain-con
MKHTYIPKGVCSRQITIDVEDGIIKSVEFVGGCAGNTAGVSKLCVGRKVDDVIELLRGTQCRNGTSCPDQLSYALEETKELVGA